MKDNTAEHTNWVEQDYISLLHPESFCRQFLKRELYPFQKTICRNILKYKKDVILCSRQIGKTEVVSIFALWYICANPNKKVLIFAPKYEQAVDNLFARLLDYIKTNTKLMDLVYTEPTTGKKKLGIDNLKLSNGSTVRAMSASKDANIEGWTGDLILIDESQGVSDVTFYKKIMPMASSTGGTVVQIGTPRSRNHFYACYNDRETWKVLEFDWKHGTKKYQEEVLKLKKIMPHDDFGTEYELQWINTDALYFPPTDLDTLFMEEVELPYVSAADKYIGIDLGKTMDKTVVTVVCSEGGIIRVNDIIAIDGKWDVQKNKVLQLLDHFRPKKILVDSTGLGNTFLDFLQAESRIPYLIEGYIMSMKNKASELYPNLKLLVSSRTISLPPSDDLELEMRELQKTVTSFGNELIHHPPKGHDDFVDSLALAVMAAKPFETRADPGRIIQFIDDGNDNTRVIDFSVEKKSKLGGKCLVMRIDGKEQRKDID